MRGLASVVPPLGVLTDSYKACHYDLYPPGTSELEAVRGADGGGENAGDCMRPDSRLHFGALVSLQTLTDALCVVSLKKGGVGVESAPSVRDTAPTLTDPVLAAPPPKKKVRLLPLRL